MIAIPDEQKLDLLLSLIVPNLPQPNQFNCLHKNSLTRVDYETRIL